MPNPIVLFAPMPLSMVTKLQQTVICLPSASAISFLVYFMVWRSDVIVVLVAIAGVITFGVLDGLLAAIAISIGLMLRRIATASVSVLGRLGHSHDFVSMQNHPEARSIPGVIVFRPESPMFFANAERITTEIRNGIMVADERIHSFVISLEESYDLDSSSLQALADLSNFVGSRQKHLLFARIKDHIQDILNKGVTLGLMPPYECGISVDDTVAMATNKNKKQSKC